MCTSNEYTYVYPDGRREKLPRQTTLCPASRHGVPCASNVVYKHPHQQVPFPGHAASPPASSPYLSAHQYPPTPTYTPRSSTPNYRSGDDSDRSAGYHSGSSSRSKGKHRSSPRVYINGEEVQVSSPSSSSSRRSSDRVVMVDGHHSPRSTPSRPYGSPNTTPSSPSSPYIVEADPRRGSSSSSRRPVIVDDRQGRVEIDIVDADRRHGRKEHKRHTSSSSYNSFDEDDYARLRRKEAEREQRKQAQRDAKVRDRIAQANAEIAGRPAAPMPPQPPRRSNTFSRETDAELVDSVRRMNIQERERQRERDAEDEAQRQRLRERMMPRRRNTVTGGSRRHPVIYDDGTYR